jgi:hypothetical protein
VCVELNHVLGGEAHRAKGKRHLPPQLKKKLRFRTPFPLLNTGVWLVSGRPHLPAQNFVSQDEDEEAHSRWSRPEVALEFLEFMEF